MNKEGHFTSYDDKVKNKNINLERVVAYFLSAIVTYQTQKFEPDNTSLVAARATLNDHVLSTEFEMSPCAGSTVAAVLYALLQGLFPRSFLLLYCFIYWRAAILSCRVVLDASCFS
jgi:hypothetical protein